jgi:predicted CopG family antitoxin
MKAVKIDDDVYWKLYELKTTMQLGEQRSVTMSEVIKGLLANAEVQRV